MPIFEPGEIEHWREMFEAGVLPEHQRILNEILQEVSERRIMPTRTTTRTPVRRTPRYTIAADPNTQTVITAGETGTTVAVRPRIYNAYDLDYDNMEAEDTIKPLLFDLANELGRDIYYGNPHEDIVRPDFERDGRLTWLFWSAPQPCHHEYKLTAFGMTLNGGQKSSLRIEDLPEEVGELYRDENGVAVMLVCEDTVYIPFDLPHKTERTDNNHAALMEKLIALYKSKFDPKEEEMRRVARETAGEKQVPTVLKDLMFRGDDGRKQELRHSIEHHDARLLDMERSMLVEIQARRAHVNQLQALNVDTDQDAQVEKVLRGIGKLKGVTKVTSRMGNKLIVTTAPVFIDTTIARYNLGRYSIELSGGNLVILVIKALDKGKGDQATRSDHPHVMSGLPCLGNMKEILDFVAQGDIVMTVASTLEFLHSYNPDSAYTQIDMWERVAVMKDGVMTDIKTEEPVEVVGVVYPGERTPQR